MKLLLDTYLLLQAAAGTGLSAQAEAWLGEQENQPLFSGASLWEVAVKAELGRPDFAADPALLRRGLLDNGYLELPVLSVHAAAVAQLPPIHKDPFDRMLVAQAMIEGVILLTSDSQVARYPGPIQKV